jgi:hypothetical protein
MLRHDYLRQQVHQEGSVGKLETSFLNDENTWTNIGQFSKRVEQFILTP